MSGTSDASDASEMPEQPVSSPEPNAAAAELLDVRGMGCGSVLVRLAQRRREIRKPATILLWTDDGGADEELPSWCRMTNQSFGGKTGFVEGIPQFVLHLTPHEPFMSPD
jgi:TusA-related sulfurtransferase